VEVNNGAHAYETVKHQEFVKKQTLPKTYAEYLEILEADVGTNKDEVGKVTWPARYEQEDEGKIRPSKNNSRKLSIEQIRELEALASVLTLEQIAEFFGMRRQALYQMINKDERISVHYKRGKYRGIKLVTSALLKNALTHNNVSAQIFYLKTKARWKEAHDETDAAVKKMIKFLEEIPLDTCTPKEIANIIKQRAVDQGIDV
jgi:hypothetical protein